MITTVLYVIHQPAHAGQSVHALGAWLAQAGDSLGTFLHTITH